MERSDSHMCTSTYTKPHTHPYTCTNAHTHTPKIQKEDLYSGWQCLEQVQGILFRQEMNQIEVDFTTCSLHVPPTHSPMGLYLSVTEPNGELEHLEEHGKNRRGDRDAIR